MQRPQSWRTRGEKLHRNYTNKCDTWHNNLILLDSERFVGNKKTYFSVYEFIIIIMVSTTQEWEIIMSKLHWVMPGLTYPELVCPWPCEGWRYCAYAVKEENCSWSNCCFVWGKNKFIQYAGFKMWAVWTLWICTWWTPGSSDYLLVSQSASATFCSAANSSGACAIWTGNLRKLPNSTRCKLCLCSGILLQWIGIFHWGFGSWCTLQHLDYLNRRPTHVFVR